MNAPLFISCLEGFERFLVRELKTLGIPHAKGAKLGVLVPQASLLDTYRICYGSRLALRVFWQLHNFTLWKPQNLYQQVVKMPWSEYFPHQGVSFYIGVSGRSKHFPNTLFAIQKTKDAICDHLTELKGWRPNVDKEKGDVRLQLHLQDDQVTLYFDCSGASLNQRGYRGEEGGLAPLNEVVAASLLTVAGYDGFRPFCDPCCGTATLLMEAAMIASNIPAGFLRSSWGFQKHPYYKADEFSAAKMELNNGIKKVKPNWFIGFEKDATTVAIARANLKKFEIEPHCVQNMPFEKAKLQERYFVLTNPPFGRRLQDRDLCHLYHKIGQFLSSYASRGFVFSSQEDLLKAVGLPILQSHPVFFGGQNCLLARFQVHSSQEGP